MLRCDMTHECTDKVTHLGEKGWTYCTHHAPQRQGYERTRKLRAWEIRTLEHGGRLRYKYTPQSETGVTCSCRRGIERDNCPKCEGTGRKIDFHALVPKCRCCGFPLAACLNKKGAQ